MIYYFLDLKDLIFTPLYFILTVIVLVIIFSRMIRDRNLKKYFFWGIILKMLFAILFGVIYEFYYYGGDTSSYFQNGKVIGDALFDDPIKWIKLLLYVQNDPSLFDYVIKISWYHDPAAYFPSRIVGILSPFCLGTYSIVAMYFSIITFSGQWAMYSVLHRMYPKLHFGIAIAVFFFPSCLFWGAGIMKDGIALAALGWLFYGVYYSVIERTKVKTGIILIIFSAWILIIIKIYILVSFVCCLFIWIFLLYINKIDNEATRAFLKPVLFFTAILVGMLTVGQLAQGSAYNLENVLKSAQSTSDYLKRVSITQGGAYYNLGEIEYSFTGLIRIIPASINVSLFRPYLWESRNVMVLMSALESFFTLVFTIRVLYKKGIKNAINTISNQPFLIFAMAFVLLFAFSIGISTSNFGSLVRYKLPLLPFYWTILFVVNSEETAKSRSR